MEDEAVLNVTTWYHISSAKSQNIARLTFNQPPVCIITLLLFSCCYFIFILIHNDWLRCRCRGFLCCVSAVDRVCRSGRDTRNLIRPFSLDVICERFYPFRRATEKQSGADDLFDCVTIEQKTKAAPYALEDTCDHDALDARVWLRVSHRPPKSWAHLDWEDISSEDTALSSKQTKIALVTCFRHC